MCALGSLSSEERERETRRPPFVPKKKATRLLVIHIMADENDDYNRATLTSTRAVLSTLKIENDRCADCPTRNPDWASVTNGVWLCLGCSECTEAWACTCLSSGRSPWTVDEATTRDDARRREREIQFVSEKESRHRDVRAGAGKVHLEVGGEVPGKAEKQSGRHENTRRRRRRRQKEDEKEEEEEEEEETRDKQQRKRRRLGRRRRRRRPKQQLQQRDVSERVREDDDDDSGETFKGKKKKKKKVVKMELPKYNAPVVVVENAPTSLLVKQKKTRRKDYDEDDEAGGWKPPPPPKPRGFQEGNS